MLTVSEHAITRAVQRGLARTTVEAERMLTSPAMQAASDFGAKVVRLGTGHRVVIECGVVVTVLPPRKEARQ